MPLVSSILGFPEEKGKACVMLEIEEDDEYEESLGSPEIMAGCDLKTSPGEAPACAVLELGDMEVIEMTESSV